MLKSIGSSENGPDKCVCKTTETRHGLVSAVRLLRSACACMFSLIFSFYRHSVCCCGTTKVIRNSRVRKLGYEANNFRVSCRGSSVAVYGY